MIPHYIYKCKHGRITANCRCTKLEHQVKLADCKARACIDDDLRERHGRPRT